MATCKYGPLVSEVRGSIGGTTFTAGHFGSVLRQRRYPVHTPTERRAVYKGLLSLTTGYWTDTLDQGERNAWDNLAADTDFKNSLGETYHPTGINLFCRSNILIRHPDVLGEWVVGAPGSAIGLHYPIAYTSTGSDIIEAFMPDPPIALHEVYMWHGYPQRPSVKYYTGPWRHFQTFSSADLHMVAQEIFHIAQHIPNFRYFTRDRAVYPTGEISAPHIKSVIVTH